jgi:HD-GYP domain-containing protein (c-di-GMP phosphodiesterase class II)
MLKIEKSAHQNEKARANHAELGYRMLARIRLWEDVAPIVHSHHEWHDGTGYPEGLAGNDIAIESRIIAVCESFDAMTSSTSYKVAMPIEAAVEEVRGCAGTQFDPKVAQTFLELVEQGLIPGQ